MKNATNKAWEEYRREMIAETERFIEWGLAHPDEVIEIPAKRVTEGAFPPKMGEWFWTVVLADKVTDNVRRWRDSLRRRPRRKKDGLDLHRRRIGST